MPPLPQGRTFHLPESIRSQADDEDAGALPVCGQPFEIEVGFYYGTGFVSYALAVLVSGISFVAWKLTLGMSLQDNRLFWWLGVNAILLLALQPALMRLSRTIWIYFFVWYDPAWMEGPPMAAERTNEDLKNNW
jgi:hypothetical protein